MRILALTLLFVFTALTSSAATDEVSALYINNENADDSIATVCDTLTADTTQQRAPWYVRFYRFAGKVLSPKRDLNYIDVQDYYNWCGELQLTSRFESYEIDATNEYSMRISPDTRWRIGPFFGWRFAFLGYNFDIKSIFFKSDDTDFSGSVYSAAFGIDFFYRRVGGNYNIRKLRIGDKDYSDVVRGQHFDGLNLGMTRLSFYYITNYKHYSHQAAFNQTHRQLMSAGSPVIGIQYAHNRSNIDVAKLAGLLGSDALSSLSETQLHQTLKNNELSLTAGYGYNWVFAKNWLAAGELTGSFGYLVQHGDMAYKSEEENEQQSIFRKMDDFYRKNIAFSGNFRFAVLWNNGPWFAGTQVVGFYYQYGNGNVMTRNLLGCAYIYVGFNF